LLDTEPSGWIIEGLARLDQVKQRPLKRTPKSTAIRELRPWHHEPDVQDLHERLLALMTRN
jgi:hypothetical protein